VLSLLPGSALGEPDHQPPPARSQQEVEQQREQMKHYSTVYERWMGGERGFTRAMQRGLDQRFHELLTGASVLDIGNGGTTAEVQLGPELSEVIGRFIALDKSSDMLRRNGVFGDLILGDGFELPFAT